MHRLCDTVSDQADEKGFTLVELLIAMALLGVAMTAIYSSFFSQQKSYVVQAQVAAMQQNLRAAMHYMTSDIRMAGYDKENAGNFGLVSTMSGGGACNKTNIAFTIDADEDGNLDNLTDTEMIAYRLNGTNLQRYGAASGWQDIARHIDALDFIYLGADKMPTADLTAVRFIEISVVAQAASGDRDYVNTTLYYNRRDQLLLSAPNDNLRRRRLVSFLKCRNLGV